MKMIDHNHFICHLILGTFTEYPYKKQRGETSLSKCITSLFYIIPISFFKTQLLMTDVQTM